MVDHSEEGNRANVYFNLIASYSSVQLAISDKNI